MEKRWHFVRRLLSMLGGDGVGRQTHQVTWPAGWMCMQGKKRKKREGNRSALRLIMVSHSSTLLLALPSSHSHSYMCTPPPSSCLWRALLLSGGHEKKAGMESPHPPLRGEALAPLLCWLVRVSSGGAKGWILRLWVCGWCLFLHCRFRNSICFPTNCNLIPQLHHHQLMKTSILVEPDEQAMVQW